MRRSPRSGKKLVAVAIIIVVVLGALAVGATVGGKLLHKSKSSGKAAGTAKEAHDKQAEDKKDKPEPVVVALGEFTVNLGGATAMHYLRTEVSVALRGLSAPKKEGEGAAKEAALPGGQTALAKDSVVTVLSAADFTQLRAQAGRQKLKQQLKTKLQEILPDYEIVDVLFTSFIIQ